MQTLRRILKSLVIGAILFLFFRYLASFSPGQSWALTLVSWLGYELFNELRTANQLEKTFCPFWVRVSPNWYELLRDYGVVTGGAEAFWSDVDSSRRQLQRQSEGETTSTYSVLRNDIVFTVLKSAPPDDLIYWDSRRIFRSEMDFQECIVELKVAHPSWGGNGRSVDLFFKWGADGYEFGLEVNADWWGKVCAADETGHLSKIRTNPEYLTGTTRLVVAILPYSEFRIYTHGNALASLYDAAARKEREKRRNAELANAGWVREESDWELDYLGFPECIKHKYFTVEHRPI